MSDDDAGHGRGRPQKFPGEGARISHSLRLKPVVAERLRIAAQAANRTLGEEMELRINASFDEEDLLSTSINDEVAKRTYIIMREAEFRRLQSEYTSCIDNLNMLGQYKYNKQLEEIYFQTKLRVFKRLKSIVGNRLFRFYTIEHKTSEAAVEKAASDIKNHDESIAAWEEKLQHTKSLLNSFYADFPELYNSEYNDAIRDAVRRINKNWRHNRRVVLDDKEGEIENGEKPEN